MKHIISIGFFLSFFLAAFAQAEGLPKEVQDYVDRENSCYNGRYMQSVEQDVEQIKAITAGLKKEKCEDLPALKTKLKSRFKKNKSVLQAIEKASEIPAE